MIQEAERCLEVTDDNLRYGMIIKFRGDIKWWVFSLERNYPYTSDLLGGFETPHEAWTVLADHERRLGYDIGKLDDSLV